MCYELASFSFRQQRVMKPAGVFAATELRMQRGALIALPPPSADRRGRGIERIPSDACPRATQAYRAVQRGRTVPQTGTNPYQWDGHLVDRPDDNQRHLASAAYTRESLVLSFGFLELEV